MELRAPTDRRAWPLPARSFAMHMTWNELLFLHWPVPAEKLRTLLPRGLELDTHDGDAWLGVVPFRMSGVRLRGIPGVPTAREFPELNVRTYVRRGEQAGVWFFSLDAGSKLSVRGARAWFGLPYFDARMSIERTGAQIDFRSERTPRRGPLAHFRARYEPSGEPLCSEPGSLERFLTSRYCLYAQRRGQLVRGEVDHPSWPLQRAQVEIEACTMAAPLGVELLGAPHALYAQRLDVRAWSPERT